MTGSRPSAPLPTATGEPRRDNRAGWVLTALVVAGALLWLFPVYWTVATSIQTENDVVSKNAGLLPQSFTFAAYVEVFQKTKIVLWYLNSIMIALIVTVLVVAMSVACGYALSQLRFPGRRLLLAVLVLSVMVPTEALIINHFELMNIFGFVNTWQGILLPQIIVPASIIIFKQFFDQIPREYREAAVMDNAGHFRILWKIYVPMNWGVITAIGITTFISAWNNFLWPFLIATSDTMMTIPVGITQIKEAYGLHFARDMATAVLAGLPVAILYIVFQKRITAAIMLSAGIKG